MGSFHHVSKKQMDRYFNEFAFRGICEKCQMVSVLQKLFAPLKAGKRLMYRALGLELALGFTSRF